VGFLHEHALLLNIFNILNQASPTDVVLNALALEFVFKIDEEYAKSVWWDPNKRWLKAGIMEVAMQSTLRFRVLQSARLFSDHFGVTEEEILLGCDDDVNLLKNEELSSHDCTNFDYKDDSELFEHFCMEKSRKVSKTAEVKDEFTKLRRVFGAPEQRLFRLVTHVSSFFRLSLAIDGFCVFNRHRAYCTWSRWKKVLFIPAIPELDELFEINADGVPIISKLLEKVKHKPEKPFYNFSTDTSLVDPQKALRKRQCHVLSFQAYRSYIKKSLYERDFDRFLFWLWNGLLEWLTFIVQVGFPLYNIGLLCLVPSCLKLIDSLSKKTLVGDQTCNCMPVSFSPCVDAVLEYDPLAPYLQDVVNCTYIDEQIRYSDFNVTAGIQKVAETFQTNVQQLFLGGENPEILTVLSELPCEILEACSRQECQNQQQSLL